MFIVIVFRLGSDKLSILTPLVLPSSFVSLSYFIFAVPMLECLGKTLVHEFLIS